MPVVVKGRRTGAGGSAVIPLATRKAAIVGATRGKNTLIVAEALTAGGSTGATGSIYQDQVTGGTAIRSLVRVANVSGATPEVYTQDVDFTVSGVTLNWTSAPALPTPEFESVVNSSSAGGAWTSGVSSGDTVSFIITAKDQEGTGETLSSSAILYTISAATEQVTLQWGKVVFAGGYNIYLSGATGTTLITTVAGAETTSYVATGDSEAVATSLPTGNTTHRRPGPTGQTYYVQYYYPDFTNAYTYREYTNLSDVQTDHGIGSDVSNAAKLTFENGASNIFIVGASGTTIADFQAGIDQLRAVNVQYIAVLKSGDAIEQYLRAHCEQMSGEDFGLRRYGVISAVSGSSVANVQTWAAGFGGTKRVIPVVTNGAAYYVNTWQQTDGAFVDGPFEVAHYFYAATIAGRICGLPDSATPLTNALVNGWAWPAGFVGWVDAEVKDTLEAAGVTYVMNEFGTPVVYHGITNNTSTVEDQEISVSAAEDELYFKLVEALSGFRGTDRKVTVERLDAIATRVVQVLGDMVKADIIQSFGEITVTQDATLPTRVNIRFQYTPVYPLNELIFEYGFAVAPLATAA